MDFLLQICQNYVSKRFVLLASKHPRAAGSSTKVFMSLLYCIGFANYTLWSNKLHSFSLFLLSN